MDIEQFATDLKHIDGTPYELTDAQRRVFTAFEKETQEFGAQVAAALTEVFGPLLRRYRS